MSQSEALRRSRFWDFDPGPWKLRLQAAVIFVAFIAMYAMMTPDTTVAFVLHLAVAPLVSTDITMVYVSLRIRNETTVEKIGLSSRERDLVSSYQDSRVTVPAITFSLALVLAYTVAINFGV